MTAEKLYTIFLELRASEDCAQWPTWDQLGPRTKITWVKFHERLEREHGLGAPAMRHAGALMFEYPD